MERQPFEDSDAEEAQAPQTEPKGELVPPPSKSPMAVEAASGDLPGRPRLLALPDVSRPTLRQVIERALDVLDAAGDAIAIRLRLR